MLDPNPTTVDIGLGPSESGLEPQALLLADDFHSLEILGSVPIWGLCGLRLERMGSRRIAAGWEVGVYRMGLAREVSEGFFANQGTSPL